MKKSVSCKRNCFSNIVVDRVNDNAGGCRGVGSADWRAELGRWGDTRGVERGGWGGGGWGPDRSGVGHGSLKVESVFPHLLG